MVQSRVVGAMVRPLETTQSRSFGILMYFIHSEALYFAEPLGDFLQGKNLPSLALVKGGGANCLLFASMDFNLGPLLHPLLYLYSIISPPFE